VKKDETSGPAPDAARLRAAVAAVRAAWPESRPVCGLVLGSGWGAAAASFEVRGELPYERIPGLGGASVDGHAGRLLRASGAGLETLVFQGRRHWYEGGGWTPVAAPIAVLKALGARAVVLTNAAGGLKRGLRVGDLMLIRDHIDHVGANPLVGPHDPAWGPRFVDQSRVYDGALRAALTAAARRAGVELREGVYLGVSGPTYETPAEVRAFRRLGADAVGMSTVPEAILANAAGLRVAGLSCITNLAAGDGTGAPLEHGHVTAAAGEAAPRMGALLAAFWRRMADEDVLS
jgi:inosine/guanosine/xanthosine phosphorylase family protein